MDDVDKRMEEIRATAESINSGGISEGVDPQAWIYRKDVFWLLTQLEASRQECERLRGALGLIVENGNMWQTGNFSTYCGHCQEKIALAAIALKEPTP